MATPQFDNVKGSLFAKGRPYLDVPAIPNVPYFRVAPVDEVTGNVQRKLGFKTTSYDVARLMWNIGFWID